MSASLGVSRRLEVARGPAPLCLRLRQPNSLQEVSFEVPVLAVVRGICYEIRRPGRSGSPQRRHDVVVAGGVVRDVTDGELRLCLREPRRR